jgi:hypothetical protein
MKTSRINFTVAIREDIEQYIKLFFAGGSQTAEGATVDPALDNFDLMPDVVFEEEEEEEIEDEGYDEASGKIVKLVDQLKMLLIFTLSLHRLPSQHQFASAWTVYARNT